MTTSPPPLKASRTRPLRMAITIVLIGGLLATTILLALDVRNKLDGLRRATSDNILWVIAQSEVELLRLQTAVQDALSATDIARPARLEDVRLRFDVVYSRVAMLQESPLYASAARHGQQEDRLAQLNYFLGRLVPFMDGDDAGLLQGLPVILQEIRAAHVTQRALVTGMLNALTDLAEEQRNSIARTLSRLGMAAGALVIVLLVLLVMLRRQMQRTHEQAEEIRHTSDRLDTVIRTSSEGIIVTDSSGRVIDLNPAAEAMFGRTAIAARGRDAIRFLCPPDVVEAQRTNILAALPLLGSAGAPPLRLELEAQRADGTRFPIELSLAGTPTFAGETDGAGNGDNQLIVGFLRDISIRRQTERILSEALENARAGEKAKADFLAVMNHEMRTPLNGMVGAAELLAETGLSPEQEKLVDVLQRSGRLLLGHVNAVLDISAAQTSGIALKPVATDLDMLIGDCIANQHASAVAHGNRITYSALSGPLGVHDVDPARFGQIILNLLGNAVKFTHDGDVSVETEITGPVEAPVLELRVADTGPGIHEADQEHVFDEFVTLDMGYGRSEEGSGLGLAVTRRLTEAMGGTIGVESEPGEGSLFWVRLPLSAPKVPPPKAETPHRPFAAPASDGAKALSVLVIEDNAVNRFVLKSHLATAGHSVTEATDGEEGATLAGALRFDVILTDISMPRMTGIEATRHIRAGDFGGASAAARIIAVTAHALPDEIAAFRAAGVDDCLVKPISKAALLAILRGDTAAPPEPRPTAADLPDVIDDARLDMLTRQLGAARMTTLLDQMLTEGASAVGRVQAMTAPEAQTVDWEAIRAVVHQLAGTAGTFGALRLARHLGRIETSIKTGNPDRAAIAALPPIWQDTAAALRRTLPAPDCDGPVDTVA